MNLRPINTAVVLKKISDTEEYGGLETGTGNEVRYHYGEIISSDVNNVVKAGDKVFYDSNYGTKKKIEGENLIFIKERHIEYIDES